MVKRHSPGGLECDSRMLTGFVLLKMKLKRYISNKNMAGIWMDEIKNSHTRNIKSTMSSGIKYLRMQQPT